MADCKDPNDPIQKNADSITAISPIVLPNGTTRQSYVASDGTFLPSYASVVFEEYTNSVASDLDFNVSTNVIDRFVNTYGKEAFDDGLEALNITLLGKELFKTNLPNYPELQNRISTQLPITPIEYANYMQEFLQNPISIVNSINTNTQLIQSQLNDFYRQNFTQSAIGSFCSIMPNVFGAIDSFFDLVGDAQQAFKDAVDFINNFSLEDIAKKLTMKNLISKIKEQVQKIVDDTINKVKKIVENFSFENIIGQIETYINENIIAKFISLRAKALAFFSEENIKSIKKRIENIINYAGTIFKNPSLEEIQFLVYRFCAFAGQVENAINSIKKPLEDFADNYQNVFDVIKTWGKNSIAEAVLNGGAIRLDEETRKQKINEGKQREQNQPSAPPADITQEEWDDARSISSFDAAKNDSRFYIPVGSNKSWAEDPIGQKLEDGWEMMFEKGSKGEIVARLIRLQKLFGKRLTIISAYRSPEMQKVVNPKVKNGQHQHAKALDITWSGFNTTSMNEFAELAVNKCGFKGIGKYSSQNFIHIDLGPSRTWGS